MAARRRDEDRLPHDPVALTGVPAACGTRDAEQCASTGCHLGVCSGPLCPAARSEGECTNRMGCSWDPAACGGTAEPSCALDDYGVVPGCELMPREVVECSGTPGSCRELTTLEACTAVPGCEAEPRCVGDSTMPCDGAVDVCGDCPLGCDCSIAPGYPVCTGEVVCSELLVEERCVDLGCEWELLGTCIGTPEPCAALPRETCELVPGCVVVP